MAGEGDFQGIYIIRNHYEVSGGARLQLINLANVMIRSLPSNQIGSRIETSGIFLGKFLCIGSEGNAGEDKLR